MCVGVVFLLPSRFSLSLMCCRLQPVSSRLSSGSARYGSSLEWLLLRCLGLEDTQQDVVFPMMCTHFFFTPTALYRRDAGVTPKKNRKKNGAVTRGTALLGNGWAPRYPFAPCHTDA